ncbi:MAG: phosphatidylserine/phosphatidylglycerophosphate/cardiolipin synthase family protein, partial [Myxococcales bacterium]|nr:phosphatidylserine/phosphatidylglycerophosphate/cardiolipin synthase family protein [Myxococcales bacterium]
MIPHVPAAHTPYPPRPGNLVTPWVDGVAFYGRLHAVLRAATRCVWGAISFMHRDFRFPDGTPLWDALDACAARGVDVRLLFWRNARFSTAGPTDQPTRNVFHGLPEDLALLRREGSRLRARWDDSGGDPRHCHHQKTWLVDVGEAGELAFVGGMTLGTTTVDDAAHLRPSSRHDVFCELRGPAAVDVAHNFAQRWNEAARGPETPPPWPDRARADDLPMP